MKNKIKLLSVKRLKSGPKKYVAEFEITSKNGKKIKKSKRNTKFGAKGMSDYTIHKDIERRNRYIKRHTKDLRTNDPTRAGFLSMYILWNKKSYKSSLSDYKRRLNTYNRTGKFPKSISGSSLKSKFGNYTSSTVIKNVHKYNDYFNNKSSKSNSNSFGSIYLYPFLVDKTRFRNLPPDIIEKIEKELQISDIINQYRKYKDKKEVFKLITNELGQRQSGNEHENIFEWDPSDERSVEWLQEASKLLTKKDLSEMYWKEAISNFIVGFGELGPTPSFSSQMQYENYDTSEKYITILLNKVAFNPSINPLIDEVQFYDREDILEYFNIAAENHFGKVYLYPFLVDKTRFKHLPPEIIQKIEEELQISDIINQYRTYKEKKRVFKLLTTELINSPGIDTQFFDWSPTDIRTVQWLKEASILLTKDDLRKIYWKEVIRKILNGFLEETGHENNYQVPTDDREFMLSEKYMQIILNKIGFENEIQGNMYSFDRQDVLDYFQVLENRFGKTKKGTKKGTKKSKVPDNVKNPKLYLKIKAKIQKDVKAKNRRWGAYDSGRLVREYKQAGGKYSGTKKSKTQNSKSSNLDRWYREKWIDACAWPKRKSCGRTKASIKSKVTYCRPSKVIDSNTPKTVQELTKAQIKKRCAKKSKNPKKIVRK